MSYNASRRARERRLRARYRKKIWTAAIIMLVVGYKYATTLGSRGFYVALPKLSKFWQYLPIPMAGFAMIVFEIESLVGNVKKFFVKEEA